MNFIFRKYNYVGNEVILGIMYKNKGVSTFVAVLVLMVLAVSAGILIYAYTMGYLGNFGGMEDKGSIVLDSATLTRDTLYAYIRNNGKTSINFDSIYVNKVKTAFLVFNTEETPLEEPLKEGQVAILYCYSDFNSAQTYEFKVISKEGVQLVFNLKPK